MSFGEDELVSPKRAVFLNGKFYVADSERGQVLVFDKNGSCIDILGADVNFEIEDTLVTPSGITVNCNGNILVGDTSDSTVNVFDQDGDYLYYIYIPTGEEPIQIAVTKIQNNLLVCTGLSILQIGVINFYNYFVRSYIKNI